MTAPFHLLHIALLPDYQRRLAAVCNELAGYRVSEKIAWEPRIEAWLSNFEGPADQLLALSMLERLLVITEANVVTACETLLARIKAKVQDGARLFHLAEQTSGQELLNVLVKQAGVRKYQILEPSLLADAGKLKKRLKQGSSVVVWDTFNGTGKQLDENRRKFLTLFVKSNLVAPPMYFAFVAGHVRPGASTTTGVVETWQADIPVVTDEEKRVCDQYASKAGAKASNRKYESGALVTLPSNPPNNVPLVLRAKRSETWHPLLERRDTAVP